MGLYKIRNSDGLFSTGGVDIRWTNTGKIWRTLGHISSHLNSHKIGGGTYYHQTRKFTYDGTEEIVEFELVEKSVIPLTAHAETHKTKREIRKLVEEARELPIVMRTLEEKQRNIREQLDEVTTSIETIRKNSPNV